MTVNINDLPTAEAGIGTTLVCGVSDFVINGSGTMGNDIQITWSGPGMIVDGDTYNPTINSSGIFTLTVENTITGCISTDEVEIFQDGNIPVVTVGPANPLTCDSISVTLFAGTDLMTPVEYTWTGPGITSLNENDQNPIVSVEGEYFVTIFSM